MKIAICAISKGEDLYLKDWVEYYKNMGVSNIIFNDNEDIGKDNQKDILKEYIESGFVIYQDYRGKIAYQNSSYQETYYRYNDKFDWIGFFDIDEFVQFDKSYSNINDVFIKNKDKFKFYNLVYLNWKCYGDNDKMNYEPIPVWERFLEPEPKDVLDGTYGAKQLKLNTHIKSFVRCIPGERILFKVPHNALFMSGKLNYACDAIGKSCPTSSPWKTICWENIWLNHYHTMTIEEFLKRRGNRKRATVNKTRSKMSLYKTFFSGNKKTPEKEKFFEDYCKEHNII